MMKGLRKLGLFLLVEEEAQEWSLQLLPEGMVYSRQSQALSSGAQGQDQRK